MSTTTGSNSYILNPEVNERVYLVALLADLSVLEKLKARANYRSNNRVIIKAYVTKEPNLAKQPYYYEDYYYSV